MIVSDEIDTDETDDEPEAWPSSDAVDFWREKTAPIVEQLRHGPRTLGQLKEWARKSRLPAGVGLVEHGIAWLELRGEVGRMARSGGFAYALPEAVEPVATPAPPTPTTPKTEDYMSSENWVTSTEAAALVGVSKSRFYTDGHSEQLERRERADGKRGYEYSRASIIKLAAQRRTQAPAADPAAKRTRALAPRAKASPAPVASASSVADVVRWVIEGRRLEQFTEAEALERIAAAVR